MDVLTKATEHASCTSLLLRLCLTKQTSTSLLWLWLLALLSKSARCAKRARASARA